MVSTHFNRLRHQNEFPTAIKKLRFQEEGGRCQHCHQLIGDGSKWHDRGPGALVAYHHITMICEGGTGSRENCMVLHKECHAPGGQPNPVLHGGRRWTYQTRTHYLNKPKCVWCSRRRKLNHLHVCRECSGIRIFRAHPKIAKLSPKQRKAQRDVCACGRGKFRVDPKCHRCARPPKPEPTGERAVAREAAAQRREQLPTLTHLPVNTLARHFGVTHGTIRRDLQLLGLTVALHPMAQRSRS